MFGSPHRRALILFAMLLVPPGAAFAETPPPRAFAPVQLGYQPNATVVPAHALDHVLVKFTAEARQASRLPSSMRFGMSVPALTGLAAVDRVLSQAGATSVQRAFVDPANQIEARTHGLRSLDARRSGRHGFGRRNGRSSGIAARDRSGHARLRGVPRVVPPDPLHAMHWGHNNTGQLLSYNWTNNNHETGSPVGTVGFDCNAQAAWDGTQGFGSSSVHHRHHRQRRRRPGIPTCCRSRAATSATTTPTPTTTPSQAGHGTACAGVAAARDQLARHRRHRAPGCSIMPLKVANSAGSMFFSAIQNALTYAADHGANVISMSLGAAITSDPATDNAITYASNAGCVILAATGNENKSTISYPGDPRQRDRRRRGLAVRRAQALEQPDVRAESRRQRRSQRLHLRRRALVGLELRRDHARAPRARSTSSRRRSCRRPTCSARPATIRATTPSGSTAPRARRRTRRACAR